MRGTALRRVLALAALCAGAALLAQETREPPPVAVVLTVQDAIGPATGDYITRGIDAAQQRGARLVVLQLDTPGGLDTAMRDIIRHTLASPVPVAVYVHPPGARAASAGTYMLYAAHVAAMAPGTNLGAATPVQIGGLPDVKPPRKPDLPKPEGDGAEDSAKDGAAESEVAGGSEQAGDAEAEEPAADAEPKPEAPPADAMSKKLVNDAVAYIRSLAELRGRNAEWAEQAVREAASLSAEQALAEGVIDLIAASLEDLIDQLDGLTVTTGGQRLTLDMQGVVPVYLEPDWRTKLLAVITNPNIAYILMLLGIYGLFFELSNPGFMLPGVTGAICLLLALYALQVLPVNYAGLGLLLLGIGFMIAELFMPSFGALGIGGVIAFIIGSIILFEPGSGGYQVSLPVIIAVAVLTVAFFFLAVRAAVSAHKGRVVSGREELVGCEGQVLDGFTGTGRVHLHGEDWQARSRKPLESGARVRVTAVSGLTLDVEEIPEETQ